MDANLQAILAQGENEQAEFKTIDLGFQVTLFGAMLHEESNKRTIENLKTKQQVEYIGSARNGYYKVEGKV